MDVTIHHRRGKGSLDAKWSEETKQTRHFCASPKEDTDPGGRNRAGLVPEQEFDSCFDRAIAAITGTEVEDPGLGMEWRLVRVAERVPVAEPESGASKVPASRVPEPPPSDPGEMVTFGGRQITAELRMVINNRLSSAYKFVLPRNGIVSLDQAAEMSDDELLHLPGVGRGMVDTLRAAIKERDGSLGIVREAFGVLVHGLDGLEPTDPFREPLAQALAPLTRALAAVATEDKATPEADSNDVPIYELELSTRTYRALKRAQIVTLLALRAAVTDRTILQVRGLGAKGLDEIDKACDELLHRLEAKGGA